MGKYNRKMRRKMDKVILRNNLKVDDVQEQAAKDMMGDVTAQTVRAMMRVAGVALLLKYKHLQKREGRMITFMDIASDVLIRMRRKTLTTEECEVISEVDQMMEQWWRLIPEKEKQYERSE